MSVYFLRNRFPPRTYGVQPPVPSAYSLSPFGLVAVIGPSSNQTIRGDVPVCEMVSGTWFVTDEAIGTGKNVIPPRGTRLISQGAAFCALVALIVYAMEIHPDVASTA